MLNVFGWLRSQARTAVLGGVSDALGEIATADAPADLDALRKMRAASGHGLKALPAAPVLAPAGAPAADAEPELPEPAQGKRGK